MSAKPRLVERRKKRRWDLSWWGYLSLLAGLFLVLFSAASMIYG